MAVSELYFVKHPSECKLAVVVVFRVFNVAFNNFVSHIVTVSGCDRELNFHFYSADSLKYHATNQVLFSRNSCYKSVWLSLEPAKQFCCLEAAEVLSLT